MQETVGIVGDGPAAVAVEGALADTDATAERLRPGAVGTRGVEVGLLVVIGGAGTAAFETANDARDAPWIALEGGGLGGRTLSGVDAGISVLGPDGPCFACLRTRVAAALEGSGGEGADPAAADQRLAGAHAGRLAVRALTDGPPVGTVLEVPYAERRLHPVPGCACADGEPNTDLREAALSGPDPVGLEAAVGRAEAAVDERLGPVTQVGELESFPAPYYLAQLAATEGFSDASVGRQAAGVAAEWNPAFVKAIGEALERYGAGVYRTAGFERAPPAGRADAVPPGAFVRPEAGYATPDPDEPIPWVEGTALATGEPAALPAEFAVFPPPEERHKPAITTGLGLGSAPRDAVLSGLYEVLERDAAMLAWYSTYEPLGLAVDDGGFRTLARRARAEELSVTPLLLTQDVDVPVVAVALHREGEWPRFAAAAAADLDPAGAARDALAEALQNWTELRRMGRETAREEPGAIGRYATFPEPARRFVDADRTVPAGSVGPDIAPGGADELRALLERVTDAGLEPYGARLTPRDVEGVGFEVVRVLIPKAQPLFFPEEPYFGERAETVPESLGYEARPEREPHPYP